ncbi:MAG: hypothetical protein HBSAPP02_17790 [Phycisphaerae bacterium]|nr:MAG: hypothetical protein HBSAPP02_17790 [Phycisphaerae bacterium]
MTASLLMIRATFSLASLTAVWMPVAETRAEKPDLYRAYFLEHQERDYSAARELYLAAIESDLPADQQAVARAGANRCRDHLVAQNFATIMPPDALGYVELSRPGDVFEKLASMVGLTTTDMSQVLAQRPGTDANAFFHIPQQVAISPALFEVLRSFGGAAVSITGIDSEIGDNPRGVMVIHHGDVNLLRGLLETAFQFAPTTEKIMDLPTFGVTIEGVRVVGVLTEALLIVGSSRDLVEGAVARLNDSNVPSLASRPDLSELMASRSGATIFALADIQAILKVAQGHMSERDRKEMAVVDAIADLKSFRWASYSWGIHDGVLNSRITLRLADNHRSIAYNLTRLPPMSRKGLAKVPMDAAAVFGFGLNPALANFAIDSTSRGRKEGAETLSSAGASPAISAMDIGREFFGNIQEVCAFVVPGKMQKGEGDSELERVPNAGVIIAVNDVARSRALWDQFLSLPGLVEGHDPAPPRRIKIGETPVTAYQIPSVGSIYLAELDGCIALGLTRTALKSAIRASTKGESILKDAQLGAVIAKLPADCTIMGAAHIGRCAAVAVDSGEPGLAMVAQQVAGYCRDTVACIAVEQGPSQFSVRMSLAGLPNLNEVLKQYGPLLNGMANMALQQEMKPRPQPQTISRKPRSREPVNSRENAKSREPVPQL